MAVRRRVYCTGDCDGNTLHLLKGMNRVGRPVWECLECHETRAGPILTKSDVQQPVATDGGEE